MTDEFTGRVALVTGAASGIGAAVANRLQRAGARVFCADRDREGAEAVAERAPNGSAVTLDVREEADWTDAIAHVTETAERLDVLVNCAGISLASPIVQTPLEEWRQVVATNLDGAFLGTKHALRAMRANGGAIVHIGSATGIRPPDGAAAYAASKAGLRMLVQSAAKECVTRDIPVRVNLVSPAGVKTPLWRSMAFFRELVEQEGSEEAAYEAMTASGGGVFMEPDDVARVVCFLVGDGARHVTGVDLPVDNGWTL